MLIVNIIRGSHCRICSSFCLRLLFIAGFLLSCQSLLIAQDNDSLTEKFEEAKNLFQLNEMTRAEIIFEQILERICADKSTAEKCVDTKISLSAIKRHDRELTQSENLLRSAEQIIHETLPERYSLQIDLYVQLSYVYEERGELQKAAEYVKKALQFSDLKETEGVPRARAYLALGFVEDSMGNYEVAVDAYNEALFSIENVPRDVSVLKLLSQTYNNVGIAYRRLGKVDQAMSHYQLALQVVNEAYGNDHVEMAFVYNSIGTVYYSKGDYGTAGDYFVQAAQIFEKNYGKNNQRTAGALNNAGLSYFRLEDYDKAANHLETAQQIKINLLGENHLETAIGYSNLGAIHLQNENITQARRNYEKSIEVREAVYDGAHPNLIDPNIQLGKLHIQNKDPLLARTYLDRALEVALERLGNEHPVVADIYFEIGNSYREEHNPGEAEMYYNRVLDVLVAGSTSSIILEDLTGVSDPLLLVTLLNALADLNLEQFDLTQNLSEVREALHFATLAADFVDELQTSYQSEASKINLIEKNYSIYTNAIKALRILYRHTGDSELLNDMFFFAEKSKAKIALELFQNVEAKNVGGVPQHVLEVENELNAEVTSYYQQLHLEKEKGLDADQNVIRAYQDSLFHARHEMNRFTENLEKNYPAYFNLKYDRNLTGKDEVVTLLQENESVLSYIIAENEIFALLICQGKITFHELGESGELKDQVNSIRKAVVSGNTEQYSQLAHTLYQKLIAPVIDDILNHELVIIPDQILHYLPFEMLLTDSVEGIEYHDYPYLIKHLQIKYAPSATMLEIMMRQKPENPRNLLAMAPYTQGNIQIEEGGGMERYLMELTPLPLTRYETLEIGKLFNEKRSFRDYLFPEQTELLTGEQATKQRLLHEPVNQYGFIHLATHAFVHETNPELSGIAFQGTDEAGSIMYVSDIYNLQMNADLVVLGACETGLGTLYRGEGLIGFTRAFIYAGTANLVVSMWRVNDHPTANLMIEFYRNIREGTDYGEALRQAKLELIKRPETAAPRNWAAFILNGR